MSTWTKRILRPTRSILPAFIAALVLTMPAVAHAQKWTALSLKQKEALAPIEQIWDTLPEKQQKRLLITSRQFHALSPEKKQRYLKNLADWSKLSPEQRDQARAKYKAFKKVAPEKREEVKRMVLEKEAEKARDAEIGYAPDYRDETTSEEKEVSSDD